MGRVLDQWLDQLLGGNQLELLDSGQLELGAAGLAAVEDGEAVTQGHRRQHKFGPAGANLFSLSDRLESVE